MNKMINVPNFQNVFGFDDGETPIDNQYPCNFGMGNFWGGQTSPIALDITDFRNLLKCIWKLIK